MLDLKLLKTFVTVGTLLHFGRAAEALHSTQPGVTQHIARLEEQLGVALLRRNKRSVALTEAGANLLRHATEILALAERMQDEAKAVAGGFGGQLSIGLSSAIVHSEIPEQIAAFRRAHPLIDVKPTVDSADRLDALLDASLIDAMVTTLPASSETLNTVQLKPRIAMGVALPALHPLARRKRLSVADLHEEPFYTVPRERHADMYDGLITAIRQRGHTPRIAGHEVSFANLLARVAMGDGVALVPSVYAGIVTPAVKVIALSDASLATLKIYLVFRRDNRRLAVEQFVRALSRPAA
jgi:DNA-binding transcriptional LysR family regulator